MITPSTNLLHTAIRIASSGVTPPGNPAFSIDLYTGTGAAQSIATGMDLAANVGMVWLKDRTVSTSENYLWNTLQGQGVNYKPSSGQAAEARLDTLTSFDNNGFTIGAGGGIPINDSGNAMVAWTFQKGANFFDIIQYTGDGNHGLTVAHSLGSIPGFVMVKKQAIASWVCQHRSIGGTAKVPFNGTSTLDVSDRYWSDTDMNASDVTLGNHQDCNQSGQAYTMFVFGHDTSPTGNIQCGSYTGNGSTTGPLISLGWTPQYVIIREVLGGSPWYCFDTTRGIVTGGNDKIVSLSTVAAEFDGAGIGLNGDGFQIQTTATDINESGREYIYMAIREA